MDFFDILRTVITVLILPLMLFGGQRWMDAQFKVWDRRREESDQAKQQRHAEEKEWRESVSRRLDEDGRNITLLLNVSASNTRADLLHKAHRYLDDIGGASTEEKESFHKQYEDYCAFCEAAGIENEFIEELVKQVMALPNR